jgi:hypothetical protein
MMSKLRAVVSLILALGILWVLPFCDAPSGPLAAASGITVVKSEASNSFAQQIVFTLEAASDAEITQVYLFFHAAGDERTEAADVTIGEPGRAITYVHDLGNFPLPPFATVSFWWQIEDAAGNTLTTDPQQFEYTDNRFQWEQLGPSTGSGHRAEGITVHWIEGRGDLAFGQAALDIAKASVEEINAELRAPAPDSIAIYIYDTQQNLEAAMALTGRDWAGGQARPELGVIVVSIPHEQGHTSRMNRYIPHEITHLLVYQLVTPAGYRYVPEWLDEGLATANERLPEPDYALVLEGAREEGRLIPLEDLCVPFSPERATALLAYAQSGSLVQFVREQYGAEGIRALLAAYANGAGCAGGVQEALNVSLSGLETAWRTSLEPKSPWQVWMEQIGIWAGLWLLMLLVALPMIGGLRRR